MSIAAYRTTCAGSGACTFQSFPGITAFINDGAGSHQHVIVVQAQHGGGLEARPETFVTIIAVKT
jgi:hypothetical protein